MAKLVDFKDYLCCKTEFQIAIRENFDGMHLKTEFLDELIEQYGLDRLLYLCALTIATHEWDERYSKRNRKWAKSIEFTDDPFEQRELAVKVHPAVFNGVTDVLLKRSGI